MGPNIYPPSAQEALYFAQPGLDEEKTLDLVTGNPCLYPDQLCDLGQILFPPLILNFIIS